MEKKQEKRNIYVKKEEKKETKKVYHPRKGWFEVKK